MGGQVADVIARHQPGYTEGDLAAALDTVLTAGLHPFPRPPEPAGDEAEDARAAVDLAILLTESLTIAQASAHLGLPEFAVTQYATDGDLYAITVGDTQAPRLPAWQFTHTTDDGLLPHLGAVLRRLPAGTSPLAVTRWITTPTAALTVDDGVCLSPRLWLLYIGDPTPVLDLAPNEPSGA